MAAYELKTKKNDGDVDIFLSNIDDDTRREDAIAVNDLMKKVTGKKPEMWGSAIVGFGSYTYKNSTGKEYTWMKIGYSPRKASLTIYFLDGFESHKNELAKLGKHTISKGCLYIKSLKDVDMKVLEQLIKDSYKNPSMGQV